MIDPATALVSTPLALVEHSLLNILQYRPAEIVATLKKVYELWFDAISDPQNALSAADYTDGAAKRLGDFTNKVLEKSYRQIAAN